MKSLSTKDAQLYRIERLCRLFGASKQAYYKYDENRLLTKIAQEDFALQFIREIRRKDPGIGGKKLWVMYQREFGANQPMGRDRFESIIDKYGLKLRQRMRRPRTTDSTHNLPLYPNLTHSLIPKRPNELWVSDITYIPIWVSETDYEFGYLSLILDAYTEEIIGWSLAESLATKHTLEALHMALRRIKEQPSASLIHHSDRGCQYASHAYTHCLQSHDINISMTERGDPKENAQAERINSTIKNELFKGRRFSSIGQVRTALKEAIDFYNTQRPHMSLDMRTPSQMAHHRGEVRKLWRSYRQEAIKRMAAEPHI